MSNKISYPKNSIFIPLFGFIFFLIQSCVSTKIKRLKEKEKYEWRIVKEDKNPEPTWKIYKRKIIGTSFLEYKIEGDIQATSEACLEAFKQSIHKEADAKENKKYPTYDIIRESDESLLTYVIHNEPFPFKDTEMSVRYLFFSDKNGGKGVRWHEAWEDSEVLPSKKIKRVETFRGSWSFNPVVKNSCKALNSVQFDPKGVPIWLVQPMVTKFLKDGLEDIRTVTSN